MSFQFQKLEIPEIILIEAPVFEDSRGLFMETYKRSEFEASGISPVFVQNNYSHSVQGVLRGLHYQKHPKAQGKLIKAIRGEIFDVGLDIRKGSSTYGRWIGVVLSDRNRRMLYIPVGFAHGFCVLSAEADVVYNVTEEYDPELEAGIIWNDPDIGIRWPVQDPIVSRKDARLPTLEKADHNFVCAGVAR